MKWEELGPEARLFVTCHLRSSAGEFTYAKRMWMHAAADHLEQTGSRDDAPDSVPADAGGPL